MGQYSELVKRFKVVKFKYDLDKHSENISDKRFFFGVIAQDLMKVFRSEEYSIVTRDSETGHLKVDYSQFSPLLIKAVQEILEVVELLPDLLEKIELLLNKYEIDSGETIKEEKIEACTCQCNYSCTCNCDYSCTCQCNYSCTCNCYYSCTCQCNYSCTCQCNNDQNVKE